MGYAILKLNAEVVLELFKSGSFKVDILGNPIPKDARFVRVFLEPGWQTIKMVIASSEFAEVKEDDPMPIISFPLYQK